MIKRSLAAIGLVLFALSVVAPLLWVVVTSLKSGPEIFASPWGLPKTPQWDNYVRAWGEAGIAHCFLNSVIVTVGTLAVLLPASAMTAYILARYPFRGSKWIYTAFLGGLMFPLFLTIVPLFLLLRDLGLLDSIPGLIIVYVAYSLPFTVFVLTGFFQTQPQELAEAAMIDGCGHASTFLRVMLPLARPGMVVVAVFNAIGLWNEYPLALVLLQTPEKQTLSLGIANLSMTQNYQGDWGALFAGLVIVMVPLLVVYWLFRDRIHDTMLAGALKG